MTVYRCAHCGLTCGDYAGGYSSISDENGTRHLCHPNDETRPDCYRRVTVFHEPLGALLEANPKPAGLDGVIFQSSDAFLSALDDEIRRLSRYDRA